MAAGASAGPGRKQAAASMAIKPDFIDGDDKSIRAHWALLVAGSQGWGNYRYFQ